MIETEAYNQSQTSENLLGDYYQSCPKKILSPLAVTSYKDFIVFALPEVIFQAYKAMSYEKEEKQVEQSWEMEEGRGLKSFNTWILLSSK